jgi:hypothetical protein
VLLASIGIPMEGMERRSSLITAFQYPKYKTKIESIIFGVFLLSLLVSLIVALTQAFGWPATVVVFFCF